MESDKNLENDLLNTIAARKLSFDIFLGLGRVKRNMRIKKVNFEKRQLVLSDRTTVKLSDIKALRFRRETKKSFYRYFRILLESPDLRSFCTSTLKKK